MLRRSVVLAAISALALGGIWTTTAGAKPKGEPVKVMTIYEKSAGIPNPEIPDGLKAAAKAFNSADGIGGRPVEVLVCDTANDPNKAAECGRQAVSEGVVALVGTLTTQASSFMPLMEENKIPSIGVVPAGVADFTSAVAFPLYGGSVSTFASLPRYLADDGAKAISQVRPDIAAGAILKTFSNTALKAVGQEIVNDVPVPTDAPDMSTYAQSALAGGTDAIVVGLPGQQAINFIQAVRQIDPDVQLGLISTELGPVVKALGDQSAGIHMAYSFVSPIAQPTKTGKRYLKEMKAAGYKDTTGFRLTSWVSMQVLKQIADGLPEVTGPAVFDALNTATDVETGLTPPLQWQTPANTGISLLTRIFNTCQIDMKITKKGKAKPVTGTFFDAYTGEECTTP
jgi:ABC-type branched-subunit amino acid transport system substrate-binding protein